MVMVDEGIHSLANEYVICRTLGHSWDQNPHTEVRPVSASEFVMALRCTRCYTERIDFMNPAGELLLRHYRYPDGYKIARLPRSEYRATMIARSLLITAYRNGKRPRKRKAQ